MLFILGTKSYTIKNGHLTNFVCPKCSHITHLNYRIYRRYTFITFIPLFPVDKEIIVTCDHCNEIIQYNSLPADIKAALDKKGAYSATPLWMYTGSAAIIAAAFFGIYTYFKNSDDSRLYLNSPKIGDVYNLKLQNGYYTTERIDKITKDSIFVTANDYNAYLPYETDDIDQAENYTHLKFKFSKKDILNRYQKNEIYSVTRKP